MSKIEELISSLHARADNAYYAYIENSRKDEALGWQIKVERGLFCAKELQAHNDIAEQLGRHKAFHEAANLLAKFLEDQNDPANAKPV